MGQVRGLGRRSALLIATAGLVVTAVTLGSGRPVMGGADPFVTMGVQRPATLRLAPELTLPSLDSRTVQLKDFRGRAVLLGFFTTT